MKKYIHIFLCVLLTTTGCSKKKNQITPSHQKSTKKTAHKKSSFDENLQAFALDDDSLHNFAHDQSKDSDAGRQLPETKSASRKPNSIFQWEDITADQSKDEFKTIYFEFDKYNITDKQTPSLQADIAHAKKMITLGKIIVIEGHACDSAGSAVYNMTLSEHRAKFIATQCMQAGIDKAHIKIAARGQEMPVIKGGDRHKQAVNRRVEVFAIDNK